MRFSAAIAALIFLLLAIIWLVPQLISTETFRPRIEAEASKALGRKVTIGDELSFRIIPSTAFRVRSLAVANPEGLPEGDLITVEEARVGVRLFPLISSQSVQITEFVLERPTIDLLKTKNGDINWALGAKTDGTPEEGAAETSDNSPNNAPSLKELALGDVRISNGNITYTDEQADQAFAATDVAVTARLKSLGEPLEVNGKLNFEGAPVDLNMVFTTLRQLENGEPANLKLEARIDDATVGTDLIVTSTDDQISYEGNIDLNAPDLPALASLFKVPLEEAPGFDRLSLKGNTKGTDKRATISNTTIRFDEIDASGTLGLRWDGPRPMATGTLEVGTLDLRPYMPPPAETSEGFPEWSDAPIEFASLRNMDADINISTDEILLNDLKVGLSQLKLKIDNGRMVAEIPQMSLYSGGGSGQLIVNARQSVTSFSGVFDLNAVDAQPFSLDMMKTDRLLGIGGLRINFTASGNSQAAIMSSLDGGGGFDLNDGAIRGINLTKIATSVGDIASGGLSSASALTSLVSAAQSPTDATDFSRFLSQFTIENGIVDVPTINLEGPFLTMNGRGTIDLPRQAIDLSLSPQATTTVDGEAGRSFTVPLRIGGTFSAPTTSVDAEALVSGRVEDVGRDLLNRVIGGDETDGEEGDGESVEDVAKDALNSLFGGRKKKDDDDR
ncbi:MAG: AsmA family protein [Pseudomonadota bacterium]